MARGHADAGSTPPGNSERDTRNPLTKKLLTIIEAAGGQVAFRDLECPGKRSVLIYNLGCSDPSCESHKWRLKETPDGRSFVVYLEELDENGDELTTPPGRLFSDFDAGVQFALRTNRDLARGHAGNPTPKPREHVARPSSSIAGFDPTLAPLGGDTYQSAFVSREICVELLERGLPDRPDRWDEDTLSITPNHQEIFAELMHPHGGYPVSIAALLEKSALIEDDDWLAEEYEDVAITLLLANGKWNTIYTAVAEAIEAVYVPGVLTHPEDFFELFDERASDETRRRLHALRAPFLECATLFRDHGGYGANRDARLRDLAELIRTTAPTDYAPDKGVEYDLEISKSIPSLIEHLADLPLEPTWGAANAAHCVLFNTPTNEPVFETPVDWHGEKITLTDERPSRYLHPDTHLQHGLGRALLLKYLDIESPIMAC